MQSPKNGANYEISPKSFKELFNSKKTRCSLNSNDVKALKSKLKQSEEAINMTSNKTSERSQKGTEKTP